MPAKQKPNGKWRAWGFHQGKQVFREAATKRAAQQKVNEAIAALMAKPRAPKAGEALGLTVGEYVERTLEAQGADVEHRTWHRKLRAWRSLGGALADLKLPTIAIADVRDWRGQLPRSRNAEMAIEALRLALDVAVEDEVLLSNPVRALRRRSARRRADGEGERRVKVYSDDEVSALLAACRGDEVGRCIILLFHTGLRPGEALGLQWGDIEGETLRVRRQLWEYEGALEIRDRLKTENSRRDIYIDQVTVAALGPPGKPDGLIFEGGDGGMMRKRRLYSAWRRVHRLSGVESGGRTPHCARHTHASQLLTDGVPVGDVAARLGDTIRTVLLYYSHWVPGEDRSREAVKRRVAAL